VGKKKHQYKWTPESNNIVIFGGGKYVNVGKATSREHTTKNTYRKDFSTEKRQNLIKGLGGGVYPEDRGTP